ncbi:MAG: hypothetical protein ACYC6Y_13105, partial [Thermoguttaceae bacterium]
MSLSRIGLLTAVILVGVGLAVCVGALSNPAPRSPIELAQRSDGRIDGGPDLRSGPPAADTGRRPSLPTAGTDFLGSSEVSLRKQEKAEEPTEAQPAWVRPHPSITYQIQAPPSDAVLLELLQTFKERL